MRPARPHRSAPPLPLRALPLLAAAALSALAEPASASGFHIDEQDARATGRAGAIVASTRNASAIYYNPAGLAHLDGVHLNVGASFVAPRSSFTEDGSLIETEAEKNVFTLPHLYASYRATDVLSVGFGLNAPFGLALEWPEASPGRSAVRSAELQTLFLMQVLAFDLSAWLPGLALGGGIDIVPASVRLERDILFGTDVATVGLSGSALGVGGRAGISYRPPALPGWSFGAAYKSAVDLDFSGHADFDASPIYRGSLPPDGVGSTEVVVPQTVVFGAAFRPLPEWEWEVDASWRGWSSYDTLVITLPNGDQTISERNWNDAWAVRIGTEYRLEERWFARLGFIWDQTPVPASTLDFQLPDDDRIDVTLGVGAQLTPAIDVQVSALHVLNQQRATARDNPLEPPVKGAFEISAWVFGLSVGFALDQTLPEPEPAFESAAR